MYHISIYKHKCPKTKGFPYPVCQPSRGDHDKLGATNHGYDCGHAPLRSSYHLQTAYTGRRHAPITSIEHSS